MVRHFLIIAMLTLVQCFFYNPVGNAKGTRSLQTPEKYHYVVVAAFRYKDNVDRYYKYAADRDKLVNYGWHPTRKLYYVYVEKTKEWKVAWPMAKELRATKDFYDTWVFIGSLDDEAGGGLGNRAVAADEASKPVAGDKNKKDEVAENRVTGTESDQVNQDSNTALPRQIERDTKVENGLDADTKSPEGDVGTAISEGEGVTKANVKKEEKNLKEKSLIAENEGKYLLYFNTLGIENFRELFGKVNVIDPYRAKILREYESHNLVKLKAPGNHSNTVKTVANVFGYRPVEHMINLDNPVNDSTKQFVNVSGDTIVVDFDMVRFRKGDIIVLFNVYFYKDAAIMRPESKYEIGELEAIMTSNEKMKIRIHGHTNGNAPGKVIVMNSESQDFFSLGRDTKEHMGSSKELSKERAKLIRSYLMSKGISEDRMEVKAWGGKRMIYDKHSINAKKNVRVEIEILED